MCNSSKNSGNLETVMNKDGNSNSPGLKDVFKDDFYIGVALSKDQVCGKERETLYVLKKHFNSVTPENILKWEEVHPKPNEYNFETVDKYVELGEKYNIFTIGHTLVWHLQTPDWVFKDVSGNWVDREGLLKRMKEHIFTVMERYKGKIHGWDVVNEAVDEEGSLRNSKWYEIIGEDYIQKAFEFAREADPDAELYYNDYNFEKPFKCQGIMKLIESLKERGIRIDGVGIQGHWFLEYPRLEEIEAYILALSRIGVKVIVSEMDISVLPIYPVESEAVDISLLIPEFQRVHNPYVDGLPESVEKALADRYVELFSLFHKYRENIKRVTLWAVHDRQTWRNYLPISGRKDYPMLFDRNCKPKLALKSLIEHFK